MPRNDSRRRNDGPTGTGMQRRVGASMSMSDRAAAVAAYAQQLLYDRQAQTAAQRDGVQARHGSFAKTNRKEVRDGR